MPTFTTPAALLRRFSPCVLGLGLTLAAGTAGAVPLTAQQVMAQFNLVVFGSLNNDSDVEGRAWVGGSANGGNYVQRALPASSFAGLTVLGSLSNFNVDNGGVSGNGGIAVGGSVSSGNVNDGGAVVKGNSTNVNYNGGVPSYVAGSRIGGNANSGIAATPAANAKLAQYDTALGSMSVVDMKGVMTGASGTVGALAQNSSYGIAGGLATFNAAPDASGRAVFDIVDDAVFFSTIGEVRFNLNGATSVFINSDFAGGTVNLNFLDGAAPLIGSKLLWNFTAATTLNVASQWGGSILAVKADVTKSNNIEGTLVANSLTQGGEMHPQQFTGLLPPPVSPVPEPSTYALLLAGVGLMSLVLRRRAR